ncbi:nicotinate-nucleotide--dimethylbenzimidazole phosphoribosyltransferase [Streptacidiphilus rugosus]|uniref:nicotinate-nucleotide--dimethylbenzimidazole phosphoribosyltransferase n=1 Tax=Streptacidiphilus rugosus TaxID=405783 RepID=UPI0005662755|nr:nicotinate-nucleotide--dimethylbenzimidazole phosphoribosyltransferase [Streptacidiphilus rugosus]
MSESGNVPNGGQVPGAEAEQVLQPAGFAAEPGPAQGVRPAYTFLDELDEEEDELLMPGPQGAWNDAAARAQEPGAPLAAPGLTPPPGYAPGSPVEAFQPGVPDHAAQGVPMHASAHVEAPAPSWPPLLPPALGDPQAEQAPLGMPSAEQTFQAQAHGGPFVAPVPSETMQNENMQGYPMEQMLPVDQQLSEAPVESIGYDAMDASAQNAAPRRPLHAGPPIPDPSLMTGQVPVRSLADRGPSSHGGNAPLAAGTPPFGVPTPVVPVPVPTPVPVVAPVPTAAQIPVAVPVGATHGVPEYLDQSEAAAAEAHMTPVTATVPVQMPSPESTLGGGPAHQEPVVETRPEPAPLPEQPVESVPQPVAAQPAEPAAPVESVAPVVEPTAEPAAEAPAEAPAEPVIPVQAGHVDAPQSRIAAFITPPPPAAVEPEVTAQGTGVLNAEPTAEAAPEVPAEPLAEAVVEQAAEPVGESATEVAPEAAPEPDAVPAEAASEAAETSGSAEPSASESQEIVVAEPTAEVQDAVQVEGQVQAEDTEAHGAVESGADEPEAEAAGEAAPAYDDDMREAVHRVMRERRDIRNGFRSDPIPHEVLIRVLEAAHTAPSVGYSQPWDFVVIRSGKTRARMHELAERQRDIYAESLPKSRAKQFKELKIEAIRETPVNIVVTADRTRGGRHTLGRHTQPQMAPYSAALAVENLWLAARAEGLGVGWVSFFDEEELVRELGLPDHLEVVAYLCVGYVNEFPEEPELAQAGWAKKRPLSWVVHEETYGRRALPGEEPHSVLQETLRGIRPLDAKALGEAWDRQKRMTKPAGSLGMLEIISAQLCGLSRKCPPPIPEPACVAVFAGDHGVHAQGVTPWPQEVTAQMVGNFLAGGAVVNAFANQLGAEVCVVDVGVASELPPAIESGRTTGLLPRKVRPGTADMTQGPAMSREEAMRALEVGIETARDLVAAGNKALVTGDMGIANTTAAAALICVFTGEDPAVVTGRGTGIDDETHARKIGVIRQALDLHRPDPSDPIGVLAAVGGLEHAAIAGFLLGAASLRTPVILDGVIAGSAALVAKAIAPEVLAACIAGHRSAEPGHKAALAKLGLRPLIDLDLRLGEGTGALLALPLVQSAARAMHDVATFDSAGVTDKH